MKIKNIFFGISYGLLVGMCSQQASANPTGAQVINGQVTFTQPNLNTLQINNSNGAIVNWQSFSINTNELTHFQQSGANSAILNKVVGNNVSNILGNLTSNGQVYLINQHGIIFGENSIVNTAGFIASTLNISNQDFLQGKLNFEGVNAADILNKGFITAGAYGDIALIAPNIVNEGIIKVEQGDVILAAGEKVTLTSLNASDVGFEIQSEDNAVINLGSVTTDGGAVGMFAGSLTHSGTIEANALSLDENGNVILIAKSDMTISENSVTSANGGSGGRIVIKSETGTTLLSGDVSAVGINNTGGVIDVLGNHVGIIDSATLNASGNQGGGEIHVGGNYQGKGELKNASATYVGEFASLKADAIQTGNGGEIIVWADETARVHGAFSATGGNESGNGGFIETSGKQFLDVTSIELDLSAENGSNGEWLLDPFDLTISTAADATSGTGPSFTSSGVGSVLNVDTLLAVLDAGTSVTIDTGISGGELGDININTAIAVTGGNAVSLTLNAENNININSAISSSNTALTLDFNADSNYNAGADGLGKINVNNSVSTNGGAITFLAGDGILFGTAGSLLTSGGAFIANTSTGDIAFSQTAVTAINAGTGTVTLTADKITDNSTVDLDVLASSLILNTSNGAGVVGTGELDTQVDVLSFTNTTTGAVAVINNNAAGLTVNGINSSTDSGTVIKIEENLGDLNLNNITGGVNGDLQFNTGMGSINLLAGQTITGGTNANNISFTATSLINLGVGSVVTNNAGFADIFFDAIDIDFTAASVDANGARVHFNPVHFGDIGIGNGTSVSAGFVVDDAELANINAGVISFGNLTTSILNIGTLINLTTLGNDLELITGQNITFETASGIDVGGGKLKMTAQDFDFVTNTPTIQGTGIIEFVNASDSPDLEITLDCVSTLAGMCITQTNLNNITDGFSTIVFATENGDIHLNSALTFVDPVLFDTSFINGDININAALNFGTNDVTLNTGFGFLNFNQIAGAAGISANNVFITAGTVSNSISTTASDIIGNQLTFLTDNGFGDTTNPFLLSMNEIVDGLNTNPANEIFIVNNQDLLVTSLRQGVGVGLSTTVNVNGNLTVGQIDGGSNTVVLDTTSATNGIGGAIFDDTLGSPNVINAYRVELYSETGIGDVVDLFEVANINDLNVGGGGLFTSAVSSGDIFINNVAGLGTNFDIQAVLTNSTGSVFIHNGTQTMNLNSGIATTAGSITLESNSDINLIAGVNAGGGSNVDINVVGGAGNINVNSGVIVNGGISTLSTNSGGINFGASGFVSATTGSVLLNASGVITDAGATSAIGGGSAVDQFTATSGSGISLTGAGNDVNTLYLATTANDISYVDANGFSLDAAYATNDGLGNGIATGNVTLTALNTITDANAGAINIAGTNVTITASNGIGNGDALETNILTSLNFTNTLEGIVQFLDTTFNTINVQGVNSTANTSTIDFTEIVSQNGSLVVPVAQSISSANADVILSSLNGNITVNGAVSTTLASSFINLDANLITISGTGSISATGISQFLSIGLITDEIDIAGSVNAGVGDLALETRTNGLNIFLGSLSDNVGAMDISQAEVSLLSAGRLGIGAQDFPVLGQGTNIITFEGAINTGTIDTRLASIGNIVFDQGAATALTSTATNGVEINTKGSIVDLSAGVDVSASSGLFLSAINGIGDLNAIETQAAGLQIFNGSLGAINIDNNIGNLSIAFINQGAANDAINLTSTGGISFIDNGADVPGITSMNGVVNVSTSAGAIVESGFIEPTITGASSVTLNSTTGVGSIATPITLDTLGAGGLTATVSSAGDIYVNNNNTSAAEFVLAGLSINNGTAVVNNLDAAADTRITGAVNGNGSASIISLATMQVDGSFNMSTTGSVDLQSNGAGGSIFVNSASIVSATGNINLLADTDINLLGTTNLTTALPGTVTLTATNGQLFSDATVSIVGGGNLNITANTGVTLSGSNNVGALNLSSTSGNITFTDINNIVLGVINASALSSVTITTAGAIIDGNGVANNISAQTISLNAANGIGTIADPIELAAQNYFNFSNSTSGDVVAINSVANSLLLSGLNLGGNVNVSYDNTMQVLDVSASGNMVLTSINGSIIDSNDAGSAVLNLSAANIDLTSFNHIGDTNPIETQLTGTTGSINVNNTSTTLGNFEIENWAVNSTDVATFTANNLALNGDVYLLNPLGVMSAGAITANQGFIELKAIDLNLIGAVNNNDVGGTNSILLVADDMSLSGGTINANNGGVDIVTLTDLRGMTLGAIDATGTTLDLVQADATAITASSITIGLMDTVTPLGTGNITIAGPFDVGAKDLNVQTLANIIFTNGTASGLSTTGLMDLNADLAIIGDNSTGVNLTAAGLSIEANNGIGSVDAIRTQVTDLTTFNQFSNNLNISNSGALNVSDSANLAGSMSISSDNSLTLTPFMGLAGTTGAVAQSGLTLQAASGLFINGVASATNVNLLSANAITINENVVATGNLVMNADTDANSVGDLLIENINTGTLSVSAANMSINAATVSLQSTSGAVHVESAGLLSVVAANDLNILGGATAGFDAYLSAAGNINMDIGGNVLLSGGGDNTAASIFDVSGTNTNILNMTVDGSLSLSAGVGASSGSYIKAGEVRIAVAGDASLTGSTANLSPAEIKGSALNMLFTVGGGLTLTDGTGTDSLARVISNNGLGYMQVSFASCTGCANGLLFLDQPITNTASNEIVSTQNGSVITTEATVSSSESLITTLEESSEPVREGEIALVDSESEPVSEGGSTSSTEEEEKAAESETEQESQVLVCR